MLRVLLLLGLLSTPLLAQSGDPDGLVGRVEGRTYVPASGAYRVAIPVLPELGGRINDTETSVTFQDDFNVLASIAVVEMDATQRWELSTRGRKEYLAYFFANFVMPDFQQLFPGASVEEAKYSPSIAEGSLIAYTLLPGGSMFAHKLPFASAETTVPVAKRGNLVFTRDSRVFVLSVELAERITERSTYKKTPAEENEILRQRLIDLFNKMTFPPAAAPAKPAAEPAATPKP